MANLNDLNNVTKKYWYVWISLCSGDKTIQKVVTDKVYLCTERRIHEIVFGILEKMEKKGMTFNGKNLKRYFELQFRNVPSPEEIDSEIAKLQVSFG